ncbi:MAG TPA: zf-HC2 domain-containing protein [Cytophagaceae bacterium]
MNKNFTFWMNKLNKSEQTICHECLKTLQLVVDGEATKEEEEYFRKHLEECMPCYNFFQVEKSVKQILQHKIEKKKVPASVIDTIKNKIRSIS